MAVDMSISMLLVVSNGTIIFANAMASCRDTRLSDGSRISLSKNLLMRVCMATG